MSIKKVFIWLTVLIGIGVVTYIGYMLYLFMSFATGCGFDDGPFVAKKIAAIKIPDNAERFNLSNGTQLVLINRKENLSPILTCLENGKAKWTLDTDVRNTKGFETCRIWKLNELRVTEGWFSIDVTFYAEWTYGSEIGSIEIDKTDGENTFCLSW